jgi:hypothetical protein
MSDQSEGGRRWIVEPPEPGEITLHMALGEGRELTPDQEVALSELLRTLEANDAEVTGFEVGCPSYTACSGKKTTTSCGDFHCPALVCGTYLPKRAEAASSWNLVGSFRLGNLQ